MDCLKLVWRGWLASGLFLAALCLAGCGTTQVWLPTGTPIMAEPATTARVLRFTPSDATLPVLDRRRVYLAVNPFAPDRWHPVQVYTVMYRVRLADGLTGWASQDLRRHPETGQITLKLVRLAPFGWLAVAGALVLAAGVLLARRRGWLVALARPGLAPLPSVWVALGIIILARLILLTLTQYLAGHQMIYPRDELGYFHIGHELLHTLSEKPWLFTIGQGLVHLPVIWATQASTYYDIVWPMSWLTATVLAPAGMVVAFLLIQHLAQATRPAFWALLAWAVLPFFYLPLELGDSYKALIGWPDFHVGHYTSRYLFSFFGFNGMSDTPSALLILLLAYLAVKARPGAPYMVGLAVLFSFACLLRLNNIIHAPLLAYLMWRRMAPGYRGPLQVLGYLGLTVLAFLLVYLPQFYLNWRICGHPLTFPYVLHGVGVNEGFEWAVFPLGLRYLIHSNYLYLLLAASSLPLIRDRHQRVVLCLWGLPLFFWFSGFQWVTTSSIRWLLVLYPAWLASFGLADWRGQLPWRRAGVLLGLLALAVLVVAPMETAAIPRQWGLSETATTWLRWGLPAILAPLVPALA